ncbi:MAG: type II secretion system F family protein, partial [Oscillospiraceae bacterium]|nr:type II secretion system F family protein [Oscillospiraceae bacterium]
MKSYTYVAKSKNGKEVRGTINAEDVKDFMAQAKAKNLEIKGYEEKDVKDSKSIRKFKTEELSFCCRQLAAMLTSGLTLVKALDILSKEQPTEQAKEVWQSIYENVQKGESFSSSLEQYRGVFPEFLISMVGAGESSGSLDTIMQRMSDHYQKEQKMNNTIKGAMTYPIILGFLCIVIIIAMFTFIMPTFAGLYESPDDMPAFTKAMMAFSDSLVHFWFVYIIVIGAIVFGITYIMKIPSTRLKFDKLIIKGPGFGPLVVKIYTARFARTLSSLYSSGIPMVECLQRSSSILGNRYIDELFENVVDEVKQGETLSSSIQRTEI